jgi:RNA polymerase sigma factor (sigma-70 family)
MTDRELLEAYAREGSEEAFRALVERYVGLVYSACARQLRDKHLAEDATQGVFVVLSEKAGGIRQTRVAGWLLSVARFACSEVRRERVRRERREQAAAARCEEISDQDKGEILELLDAGLLALGASDREAVVLRYLREQSLKDVGEALGVSEEAARKRVDRGVEKLRKYFGKRGVTASVIGVTAAMGAESAKAAGMQGEIVERVLEGWRGGSASALPAAKIAKGTKVMMTVAKLKTAAVMGVFMIILGAGEWMIMRAMGESAGAGPVSATVAASAPANRAAETEAVGVDLSSPVKTVESLCVALKAGDREKTYACLAVDAKRTPTELDGMIACCLAENRMTRAAVAAYGASGRQLRTMTTGDEVADFLATMMGGMENVLHVEDQGQTARVTLNVPAEVLAIMPQEVRNDLTNVSSKVLWFRKEGSVWKFDIDRSMRVTAALPGAAAIDEAEAKSRNVAAMLERATMLDEVTKRIESGDLPTIGAAADAIRTGANRVAREHGAKALTFDTQIVEETKP